MEFVRVIIELELYLSAIRARINWTGACIILH